jgi:hypothetical protein
MYPKLLHARMGRLHIHWFSMKTVSISAQLPAFFSFCNLVLSDAKFYLIEKVVGFLAALTVCQVVNRSRVNSCQQLAYRCNVLGKRIHQVDIQIVLIAKQCVYLYSCKQLTGKGVEPCQLNYLQQGTIHQNNSNSLWEARFQMQPLLQVLHLGMFIPPGRQSRITRRHAHQRTVTTSFRRQ